MSKGSKRRPEDTKKLDKNWRKIKWFESLENDTGDWLTDARRRRDERKKKLGIR
jgi:hypothetical protein